MVSIDSRLLDQIHAYGETAYPEEGAGLLLGKVGEAGKQVVQILPISNSREGNARHNRYLLSPKAYLHGEQTAARLGLDVIGVFHSHPDHPNRPSEFDRDWAMPWFSYIITSVEKGNAAGSRSWQLAEDRSRFEEEELLVISETVTSRTVNQ